MSTPNYFAQISYQAHLAELNERLLMNQTDQITLTDTNGQSAVYVPKEETELPESLKDAVTNVKLVAQELLLDRDQQFELLLFLLSGHR